MTRLLLLSNGHGEDAVASRLVAPLRAHGFELEALPIVGQGRALTDAGVPLIGPIRPMPSGGFVYGRPAALARDLAHGLVGLTLGQLKALTTNRNRYEAALAVGDVVPLAFAWLLGKPFGFVGCAKSDLYRDGRPGAYEFHERWLLRHPLCRAVFPRDEVTTRNLQASGIAADWLGNPMMDGLAPSPNAVPRDAAVKTILLLPGSRAEAPANFTLLSRAAQAITDTAGDTRVRFIAALAPGCDVSAFDAGPIALMPGGLADAAHTADLALAMAGTATEQVVGLGVPALTVPGPGPQFTAAFAEAQTRLLGEAVWLCPRDPQLIAIQAWAILYDPARHARMAAAGRARMGPSGAAERMAAALAVRLREGVSDT